MIDGGGYQRPTLDIPTYPDEDEEFGRVPNLRRGHEFVCVLLQQRKADVSNHHHRNPQTTQQLEESERKFAYDGPTRARYGTEVSSGVGFDQRQSSEPTRTERNVTENRFGDHAQERRICHRLCSLGSAFPSRASSSFIRCWFGPHRRDVAQATLHVLQLYHREIRFRNFPQPR